MKELIELIKGGVSTTPALQHETQTPLSTLQRHLKELCDDGIIKMLGTGKNTFYRFVRSTPTHHDILEKMRLFHQQKSMDKTYRKMTPELKSDLILEWYINNFPGYVEDYNQQLHQGNIFTAIIQLEKEM